MKKEFYERMVKEALVGVLHNDVLQTGDCFTLVGAACKLEGEVLEDLTDKLLVRVFHVTCESLLDSLQFYHRVKHDPAFEMEARETDDIENVGLMVDFMTRILESRGLPQMDVIQQVAKINH